MYFNRLEYFFSSTRTVVSIISILFFNAFIQPQDTKGIKK
jgi:hypothetical protein